MRRKVKKGDNVVHTTQDGIYQTSVVVKNIHKNNHPKINRTFVDVVSADGPSVMVFLDELKLKQ